MALLYVISSKEAAGKTTICAGVGKYLLDNGKKVGFLKLLPDGSQSGDAAFMKQALAMPAVESLGFPSDDINRVKEACNRVAQGNDVVIVEGMYGPSPDDNQSKTAYKIAKALGARVIIVEAYSDQSPRTAESFRGFEENLLGLVLNKVPKSQLERVKSKISAETGTAVLGVLPEDRALSTITVGELADCIQGKILNNAEKSAELVENFMLGAMVVDSGLTYFSRKINKAAIIRSDRPDMQLAALETQTRCLVLSGSTKSPIVSVLQKAEDKGVPIIVSESDTSTIITRIEDALNKTRFNHEKKLSRFTEMVQSHLNLKAVA